MNTKYLTNIKSVLIHEVGTLFVYSCTGILLGALLTMSPVLLWADEPQADLDLQLSEDEGIMLAANAVQGSTIDTVKVYESASTSSAEVMTLSSGTSIRVYPYKDNWYSATLNGKTVYVQLTQNNFVQYSPIDNNEHEGAVIAKTISIYAAPSANASVVDSFAEGTGMRFKSFNKDYFMASYRGKTVYIPAASIELYTATSTATQVMYAKESGVSIYAAPTTSSEVVARFDANTALALRPFSKDWYVARMSGKTVYVPASQVSDAQTGFIINYTSYNISLARMANLSNTGDRMIVRNGRWQTATTDEIRAHLDPNNYPQDSTGFFQFMRLDIPTTITTSQLNSYLSGKGTLSGQGSAFKDGARLAGLNELYLVAHAIHETGNGSSRLAQGVWYNPKTNSVQNSAGAGAVKVYNMYGIGAVDSDVIRGGARTAYNNGWTTPAKAISGGARYVGANYIAPGGASMSGQNTLYKMLWNPEAAAKSPGNLWHRYATDVNWANAQGYYLAQMFRQFGNISATFDVPRYN